MFLTVGALIGLLALGVAQAQAEVLLPARLHAVSNGPNCHGTTLAVGGHSGGVIGDHNGVLERILKSPLCTRIAPSDIHPGDIGALRPLQSFLQSQLSHSFTFLSPQRIFQKRNYLSSSPLEKTDLLAVCQDYFVAELCHNYPPSASPSHSLEIYRCQKVDYSAVREGLELDRSLREIEGLFAQMLFSAASPEKDMHGRVRSHLHFLIEAAKKAKADGLTSSLLQSQLLEARCKNLKFQFRELLHYPGDRKDVSRALDEALTMLKGEPSSEAGHKPQRFHLVKFKVTSNGSELPPPRNNPREGAKVEEAFEALARPF